MQASRRLANLNDGGDDGWGLYDRARALKEAGEPVLEMTIGEHDIGTEAAILDEMSRAAHAGATGYAPVPGMKALRDGVVARTARVLGLQITRDNVLITPGGQAGLFAALSAACDPGDVALHIDPYYATYPGTIRGVGAKPVAVEAQADRGFQPAAADLAQAAVTHNARALLINTPNNPTGAVYSEATLQGVADVAQAQDLWVISDEVYDSQVWEGKHLSPATLPGMAERTLVVGSMSKSHAMTGSRLGWVIGPAPVIAQMIDLATVTTYGVPGYIQHAALFGLQQGSEIEARIGAPFRRRRDLAARLIEAQNTLSMVPAGGAMFVMLDVSGTGLSGEDFAERLLDEERIAVIPGASFGHAARAHIRVALTLADAAFAEAMERLLRFAARVAA
ncbi:MAG: pyridoxal phosphate-dependent aminotransferase [Pseudomonadota bacterium]